PPYAAPRAPRSFPTRRSSDLVDLVQQGRGRPPFLEVAGVVTLLVPGGRGQGDEHRGLAQRGEFGDGSGATAGDDHVGQGQHVGKFGADEGGQVVALQQSGRQGTCRGTQRLQVVGTTLVDDVGAGQQPRQEITHGLVDLYRALCATGDINRGQVRRVPGEAEPFGGPVG